MAATIKHKKEISVADGLDPNKLQPSHWNDDHDLNGIVTSVNGTAPDANGNVTITAALSPASAAFLSHCSVSSTGLPLWNGLTWPGGGSPDTTIYFTDDDGNYWIDDSGNYWIF